MSKIFEVWKDRLDQTTLHESAIRQFGQTIVPMAEGYEPGGKRTNLTDDEAKELLFRFDVRSTREGTPIRVTQQQADKGTAWLHRNGKKLGLPEQVWTEHPLYYELIDFINVVEDDYAVRASFYPKYRAVYADGSTLEYVPTPWTAKHFNKAPTPSTFVYRSLADIIDSHIDRLTSCR